MYSLQEYNLEDIPDLDRFESQAATYSRIENSNLMKVEALFYDKVSIIILTCDFPKFSRRDFTPHVL